ncbi:MAG: orotidine-5'-phosphate decarboxylase [Verrucomicrobia bacterium]|nr:orotidine-5'-phosphate decarboxylase [Verrucomicrobiota bacterium]
MGKMKTGQIILALDVDTAEEALLWAKRLKERVGTFKVGLQLYLRHGHEVLHGLASLGVPVFLDLKFHDIPNTVAQAVAATAVWRPRFLTLHASGGREMMEAAAGKASAETCLLGVTVLTSLSEENVREIGWHRMARGRGRFGGSAFLAGKIGGTRWPGVQSARGQNRKGAMGQSGGDCDSRSASARIRQG